MLDAIHNHFDTKCLLPGAIERKWRGWETEMVDAVRFDYSLERRWKSKYGHREGFIMIRLAYSNVGPIQGTHLSVFSNGDNTWFKVNQSDFHYMEDDRVNSRIEFLCSDNIGYGMHIAGAVDTVRFDDAPSNTNNYPRPSRLIELRRFRPMISRAIIEHVTRREIKVCLAMIGNILLLPVPICNNVYNTPGDYTIGWVSWSDEEWYWRNSKNVVTTRPEVLSGIYTVTINYRDELFHAPDELEKIIREGVSRMVSCGDIRFIPMRR